MFHLAHAALVPTALAVMSMSIGAEAWFKPTNAQLKTALKEWCDEGTLSMSGGEGMEFWDTSEVTDITALFYADNNMFGTWPTGMGGITSCDYPLDGMSNWDMSGVTSSYYAFQTNQDILSKIPDLSRWDVSRISDFSGWYSLSNYLRANGKDWTYTWDTSSAPATGFPTSDTSGPAGLDYEERQFKPACPPNAFQLDGFNRKYAGTTFERCGCTGGIEPNIEKNVCGELTCTVPNCQTCDTLTQCAACDEGYILNVGRCENDPTYFPTPEPSPESAEPEEPFFNDNSDDQSSSTLEDITDTDIDVLVREEVNMMGAGAIVGIVVAFIILTILITLVCLWCCGCLACFAAAKRDTPADDAESNYANSQDLNDPMYETYVNGFYDKNPVASNTGDDDDDVSNMYSNHTVEENMFY